MKENFDHIVFMKFGYHALENEDDIIKRKIKEFQKEKMLFWGYGGSICHPLNQVQPFLKWSHSIDKRVFLLMSFTPSKPQMDVTLAREYSVDGEVWNPIPKGIKVTGSKYALVCNELKEVDFDINLSNYKVAIGASKGKLASNYVKFRVDKGCFVKHLNEDKDNSNLNIRLMAEIISPYSVMVK